MWCDTLSVRHETQLTARCCAHLCKIVRVVIVRVIVDGVLGVTIVVLIGHDELLVIYVSIFVVIFCNWRCTLYRFGSSGDPVWLVSSGNMDFVRHLTLPTLLDRLLGTCHRAESESVFHRKTIPSSVYRGHGTVQKETRKS